MKQRPFPIALLAALALAACNHDNPDARFAEAKKAFAAEDYAHARSAVLAALDGARGNRDMLLLLARSNLALHDGEGAGAALARLADAGMNGPEWNEMAAEAALWRGRPKDMADLLKDDQSPAAWRLRGEAALADNDSAAALADFQRGMAAGGADFRLAADYARFLIDAADIDGAERALAVMRNAGSDRIDTLLITGEIAQARGQLDAAGRAFADAAARFPARVEPLLALAYLADLRGDTAATARLSDQAAAIAPRDPKVVSLIVMVAEEANNWAKVRDLLAPHETTLDLRSADGLSYGAALLNLGHAEAARAIFQKALLLSQQNPYARLMLAKCDLAVGDGSGAMQTIRPLADSVLAGEQELDVAIRAATMAHDPALPGYQQRRASPQLAMIAATAGAATAAMGRRDWAAALAALRTIPGADRDPEVLKRLALAASNLGQADAALAYADHALELDPRNPDMLHIAGLVRINAGRDRGLAQSLLRQALERDPANRLFRADLARAGV
ncbi:tetratricopeptide repeat protein [Novosphingobium sp.]|uniref:tetratricopeptide repeat protein n=1 Tax=Novosphingobium sp. TaxID=1874826 RepID=UPI003340F565